MRINKPGSKIPIIKNAIIQNAPDIIDDGIVESGTYEWLYLLTIALNAYGLNITADELLEALNGEGPWAQRLEDFQTEKKFRYLSDLEAALADLKVNII